MRFLLLYHNIAVGGIETLMARMAVWLAEAGHSVSVAAEKVQKESRRISALGGAVPIPTAFLELQTATGSVARRLVDEVFGEPAFDVVVAFSGPALLTAFGVAAANPRTTRVCAGVWTLGVYSGRGLRCALKNPAGYAFQNWLPADCRLYMNDEVRLDLERSTGTAVPGRIWPLPVDGTKFRTVPRKPAPGLVVSVGRLADMKTYNLWFPRVLRDLLDKGVDVRWRVFGDGPDRGRIEEAIDRVGVRERVELMGSIDYDSYPMALSQARVFLGMGTALIEAGHAGVPGVAAIPWSTSPFTYGYFHQLSGYSCGERGASTPGKFVGDLVQELLTLPDSEYARAEEAARSHASRFELGPLMSEWMDLVRAMSPAQMGRRRPMLIRFSRGALNGYTSLRKVLSGTAARPPCS
jgi:glycosyltransferase involved in cell wall biosynthesis